MINKHNNYHREESTVMADEKAKRIHIEDGSAEAEEIISKRNDSGGNSSVNSSVSTVRRANKNAVLENDSEDTETVINSYGLEPGAARNLILAHNNAWKYKNTNRRGEAYKRFCEMAQGPNNDYLAAYKAGLLAPGVGEAKTWLRKTLEMNPNYKPAQAALERLENSASNASSVSKAPAKKPKAKARRRR